MEFVQVIFNHLNDIFKAYQPLNLVIFTSLISFFLAYIYSELTYKVSKYEFSTYARVFHWHVIFFGTKVVTIVLKNNEYNLGKLRSSRSESVFKNQTNRFPLFMADLEVSDIDDFI